MRGLLLRLAPVLLMFGSVASSQGGGPQVVSAASGGGHAIRSFAIRFSAPMVPLGDPRARGPFDIACPVRSEERRVGKECRL